MKNFLNLLKLDVLQRIRTYRFFVMVALGLYLAAGFVPAPDASYSTINLGDFRPIYNSVWVGALTAMMSSLLICMVGFFLIDGSLGKDIALKIDTYIRSGAISRQRYLLLKAWSNSVLLAIITLFIFLMALIMYFIRRESGGFSFPDFLIPFMLVSVPSAIFTGHLSVILETLTGRYTAVRMIIFLFCIAAIFPTMQNAAPGDLTYYRDALGLSNFFGQIRGLIQQEFSTNLSGISMGYQFFDRHDQISFVIGDFRYSANFISSRLVIIAVMTGLLMVSSKIPLTLFRSPVTLNIKPERTVSRATDKQKPDRPAGVTYGQNFARLIKIDFKSLVTFKKQNINWLIAAIWIASVFVPVNVSHSYLLPLMVLFSSNKIASLGVRAYQTNIIQYSRVFPKFYSRQMLTHLLATLIWLLLLATPIMVRLLINQELLPIVNIGVGLLFLALLAQLIGTISRSARLFEIVLVLLTYFMINGLSLFDYVGASGGEYAARLFIFMVFASPVMAFFHYLWIINKANG